MRYNIYNARLDATLDDLICRILKFLFSISIVDKFYLYQNLLGCMCLTSYDLLNDAMFFVFIDNVLTILIRIAFRFNLCIILY